MPLQQHVLEIDNEKIVCETFIQKDNVVILHGAGASNRKRFHALAEAIIRRGKGAILFDFSSHGDSTGNREDLSLKRRSVQAQQIIDTFIPRSGKMYLVGFSMSGQTVCDLLPLYKERAPAILLGCPAVYASDASRLLFGSGHFTARIRSTDSWKSSIAFEELRMYEGKTIIAIGAKDEIIPKEVVRSLRQSSKHPRYIEYPEVDHQLAVWLAAHEADQDRLLDTLFE